MFGKNVQGPGPDRGMIFQAYTSFPWLTAMQNVEYGMKILGISAAERRERAMSFLKLVHLEKFADSYPSSMSGGMKQRVALARTLLRDRPVLLLDEPFSALDDETRATIRTLVKALTERHGWITLLVSHHADDVAAIAARRYLLEDGKLAEA